ncbi:MAG TPA: HAD family phosphatase [Eubacterium sp.]|nr:HAD family phosphatase [Eubacterium sp.]
MNKCAVIFDMDGVLFDSERMIMECWRELASEIGIEDPLETCISCMGLNRKSSALVFKARYGEDFPYMEYKEEVTRRYFARSENGELRLMKGAREILIFLKDRGFRIALASSTSRDSVIRMLTNAELIDYFEIIIAGDMVENSKPAPDIYLKALDGLGIKAADAYAIEDSYNGVRSATSAGIDTIMVPDMAKPDDEMNRLACVILDDLFEAAKYIGR